MMGKQTHQMMMEMDYGDEMEGDLLGNEGALDDVESKMALEA